MHMYIYEKYLTFLNRPAPQTWGHLNCLNLKNHCFSHLLYNVTSLNTLFTEFKRLFWTVFFQLVANFFTGSRDTDCYLSLLSRMTLLRDETLVSAETPVII